MKKKSIAGRGPLSYSPWLKRLLIMKMIVILLLVLGLTSSYAESDAQTAKLNLKLSGGTVKNVIEEIERQTDLSFMYDNNVFRVDRKISINAENETVKSVVEKLISGENLKYEMVNRYIIITSNAIPSAVQQQKTVSGKVNDSTGSPLPGVSVVIKGTTTGTITDTNGNYSLTNVPENAILQFSFVGMKKEEIAVTGKTSINVVLAEESIGLDEVVAIGYGTMKKKDLTGSISRVNQQVFESRPATTLIDALRGGVAGLNIGYSTSPKGGGSIQVRGQKSLRANNTPLIVLDGVIYSGDISNINPMDIESVDVLKDASSAAIYGSRSASGVIMVTTKKGANPKPTINFSSLAGVTQLVNDIPIRTPEQYLTARRDNLYRSNPQRKAGFYDNPNNLPAGVSIDQWRSYVPTPNANNEAEWLNRMNLTPIEQQNYLAGKTVNMMDYIKHTGIRQDYNTSISAKTDQLQYYWSLGYVSNEGTTIGDRYKNLRSRLNIEAKVTNYLKIGVNSQISNSDQGFVPRGSINESWLNFESPYGSLYNSDGSLKLDMDDNGAGPRNPLRSDFVDRLYKGFDFNANLYAQLRLPYGFSYEIKYSNLRSKIQDYIFYPEVVAPSLYKGGTASRSETNSVQSYIDNLLYWNFNKGVHRINVTLLANAEKFMSYQSTGSNKNFTPNELLGYHNLGIGSTPVIGTNDQTETADALMGRINYSLMDRYIFMTSVRRDGYSAFGQKNPRHIFPAASFGWIISKESFFKSNFVDFLKFRLSWGANGNRDIGRYAALAQMGTIKYLEGVDHKTVIGLVLNSMPNSELQWESTEARNIGLDFALFKGKLNGSLEYYNMKTTNQLLGRTLPVITGYSSVITNLGQVDNQGFEATLDWTNVKKNKFSWSSYLTASMNRNKIVHLYGNMENVMDATGNVIGQKESDDVSNGWFIGHSIDAVYDYNRIGIWQVEEKDLATKFGRQPGDIKFEDANQDDKIDAKNDKKFLGYTQPRLRLGMRNDISFLDFDLSLYMYASLGQMSTENIRTSSSAVSGNWYNVPYWTPDNPTNDFGRMDMGGGGNWWNKSSFLRMQNITLGYNLPSNLLKRIDIAKLRVYLNVDNAFVGTGYYKYDPETRIATPRNISLGFNITL